MTQIEKMTQAIEGIADIREKTPAELAETLIGMGVTIQPVKLGDVLYAYLDKDIRACTVEAVFCFGGSSHESCIFGVRTEHGVQCQFQVAEIGKVVFYDPDEAREVLGYLLKA